MPYYEQTVKFGDDSAGEWRCDCGIHRRPSEMRENEGRMSEGGPFRYTAVAGGYRCPARNCYIGEGEDRRGILIWRPTR